MQSLFPSFNLEPVEDEEELAISALSRSATLMPRAHTDTAAVDSVADVAVAEAPEEITPKDAERTVSLERKESKMKEHYTQLKNARTIDLPAHRDCTCAVPLRYASHYI